MSDSPNGQITKETVKLQVSRIGNAMEFESARDDVDPEIQDSRRVKCGKNAQMYYDSGRLLGEGSLNTCVFWGKFHRNPVAIKRIVVGDQDRDLLDQEIKNLCQIHHHENVVRHLGHEKTNGPYGCNFIFVALELCDQTLAEFVSKENHNKSTILDVLAQTFKGLSHLHSVKIVHRDLNPNNILIKHITQNEIRVKISDFGISRQVPEDRSHLTLTTNSGTQGWTAPEMHIAGKPALTTKADIFSLGCVFYYVISNGSHLFGEDCFVRQANIKANVISWNQSKVLSELQDTKSLTYAMISPNPSDRPTANAVLNHHIFWSSQRKLSFLQTVSDCLETKDSSETLINCKQRFDKAPFVNFSRPFSSSHKWNEYLCETLNKRALETSGKKQSPEVQP